MTERVKRMIGLAPRQTGNKIIINVEKLEKRVALLENGVLEEYTIERPSDRNIVGSIFKGRVKNIEHGLKAMFVEMRGPLVPMGPLVTCTRTSLPTG